MISKKQETMIDVIVFTKLSGFEFDKVESKQNQRQRGRVVSLLTLLY